MLFELESSTLTLIGFIQSRTTNFKLFLPRQFLPWISNIGTPDLRRKLGQILPWESLHFITKMVDIMDTKAREIYNSKREALEEGDEELLNKVGMGKDIMSILRES